MMGNVLLHLVEGITVLESRYRALEKRFDRLDERVRIVEKITQTHESRLDDIEGGDWEDGYLKNKNKDK